MTNACLKNKFLNFTRLFENDLLTKQLNSLILPKVWIHLKPSLKTLEPTLQSRKRNIAASVGCVFGER